MCMECISHGILQTDRQITCGTETGKHKAISRSKSVHCWTIASNKEICMSSHALRKRCLPYSLSNIPADYAWGKICICIVISCSRVCVKLTNRVNHSYFNDFTQACDDLLSASLSYASFSQCFTQAKEQNLTKAKNKHWNKLMIGYIIKYSIIIIVGMEKAGLLLSDSSNYWRCYVIVGYHYRVMHWNIFFWDRNQ